MTLKKNLFAALVAVSAVAMTASPSFAHFFGHGSCGSWGGGSGGSWGGGSWGSRGSWGSGGSWGGSYGSGGSWGSGGSCGGYSYSSSCGSCGGYSSVSYGYDGGYARTGVVYGQVVSSRPMTTTVVSSVPAVKTRLTLHVPAEAKVTLAGVETKQAGEVRQFATSRLSSGQTWDDYKVVIEMNRDGKTLREERVIKLTGGEDQDLAVNFEGDNTQQVAQLTR